MLKAKSSPVEACDASLWNQVYRPLRLVKQHQGFIPVTGIVVDATASQKKHEADGFRHEPDGDTRGWFHHNLPVGSHVKITRTYF
jgi:hypothetical protein